MDTKNVMNKKNDYDPVLAKVKNALDKKDYKWAYSQISRLGELYPDSKEIFDIQVEVLAKCRQVEKSNSHLIRKIQRFEQEGEYQVAINLLKQIDSTLEESVATQLREGIEKKLVKWQSLQAGVSKGIRSDDWQSVHLLAEKCVSLYPHDKKMKNILLKASGNLKVLGEKVSGDLSKIQAIWMRCEFGEVATCVRKIPVQGRTKELTELLEKSVLLLPLQQDAMQKLACGSTTGLWEYKKALADFSLEDAKFLEQLGELEEGERLSNKELLQESVVSYVEQKAEPRKWFSFSLESIFPPVATNWAIVISLLILPFVVLDQAIQEVEYKNKILERLGPSMLIICVSLVVIGAFRLFRR